MAEPMAPGLGSSSEALADSAALEAAPQMKEPVCPAPPSAAPPFIRPLAAVHGPICGRFRRQMMCGCTVPCRIAMKEVAIDEIRPGLFIGPVQAAYMWEQLAARGVTHVVDLSDQKDRGYDRNAGQVYLRVAVADDATANIMPAVRRALPFIGAAMASGKGVLVHCTAGKSRSATICAAWLMCSEGLAATEAIAAVVEKHPGTDPNPGFRAALASTTPEELAGFL